MKYSIGQVLYIVLNKEAKVYPVQVVEELVKRTLEGEQVTYLVQGGLNVDSKIPLSDIDGEIFDTPEKVKSILLERANTTITKLVNNALSKAQEWYPRQKTVSQLRSDNLSSFSESIDSFDISSSQNEEENNYVILQDGTKAKIKSLKIA